MSKELAFRVRGQGSSTLEIDMYDVIGDYWGDGVRAKDVRRILKANPNCKDINLRIYSEGGDVLEGFVIYSLLREHQANVHVQIDGIAASMASVIAMAGDSRSMASNAFLMIHNPWGMSVGDAEDLRKHADVLEKMGENIAVIYAERSGMALDDVRAAMTAETWYTADEAKAAGFIDTITGETKAAASLRDFADYRNAPAALRAVAQAKTAPPEGRQNEGATHMKTIAKALNLPESAEESQVLAAIASLGANVDKLLKAAAQTDVDTAVGVIAASIGAAAKLQALEAEMEAKESAALLKQLQDEGKITPAQEKDLWPTLSMASKRSFHSTAVKVLGKDDKHEKQHKSDASGCIVNADGKKWEELAPVAKADLFQEDRALYDAMKADYQRRNPNS